jgi:branched-chain amino acid transport system ATP-binding protein
MTPLLETQDLSLAFGGLQVNRDISFTLAAGDRVALIGPNGAGKTTLANVICGDLTPDSGRILLSGRDITRLSIQERVRQGLVRSFQITRLFRSLTVAENVGVALMQRERLTRRLFSLASASREVAEETRRILAMLGIEPLAGLAVASLAYGQQRLLDLAIGLALSPRVLILDEPAAGVPHDETPRILEAIRRLPEEIAVLMIEHDMNLVFAFAARVLVMAEGRMIFSGTPVEAGSDEAVRRAYLGSYADARR